MQDLLKLMDNQKQNVLIGVIEDYARETSNSEIGIWIDGIGLYAIEGSDITIHEGVKYRVTIEEIL